MCISLSECAKNKDNNFNLIRFVAATLVLFSHSYALALGTPDAEPLRHTIGMTWGTIAVDVFFVISGFLVTRSFFERNNIVAFVWARFLRIFPALTIAVLFCVAIVGYWFTTLSPVEYFYNVETFNFLLKNVTLFFGVEYHLPGVFSQNPYANAVNGSLWTLPYEVKMYACLAIICFGLSHMENKWNTAIITKVFLGLAFLAVCLNIVFNLETFMSFKFIHLFSMFFVGSAYYLYRDHIILRLKWFLFILFALIFSLLDKQLFFIIYCFALPYIVFYLAYVPTGKIRSFNKAGDYSYGIYIYAFPVQQSIAATLQGITVMNMILFSFFITLILAFLSWHWVEKKSLTLKSRYVYIEKIFKCK